MLGKMVRVEKWMSLLQKGNSHYWIGKYLYFFTMEKLALVYNWNVDDFGKLFKIDYYNKDINL